MYTPPRRGLPADAEVLAMDTRDQDWPGRPRRSTEHEAIPTPPPAEGQDRGPRQGGRESRPSHGDLDRRGPGPSPGVRPGEPSRTDESHGQRIELRDGEHRPTVRDSHRGPQHDVGESPRRPDERGVQIPRKVTVGDVMHGDQQVVFPSDTLQRAAEVMVEAEAELIAVVEADGTFVGHLWGMDIFRRAVATGVDTRSALVEPYVRRDVPVARLDEAANEVAQRIREEGLRRVSVVDAHGLLVGFLTHAGNDRVFGR